MCAIILGVITPAISDDSKSGFLELSTLGARVGFKVGLYDVYTLVNGDFSGSETNYFEKLNDSITDDGRFSEASSNVEVGIGGDKFWMYDSLRFGVRSEFVYLYPFSTDQNGYRYLNRYILSNRTAWVVGYKIRSIVIGCSIGPKISQQFSHSIFEYMDSRNRLVHLDHETNEITVKLVEEVLLRMEFY